MTTDLVAVVLDFDGVVLDSARIKTAAFHELFRDRPRQVDEIVNFHMQHGGISRHKKFERIFDEILHEPLTVEHAKELDRRFVQFVWEDILRCRIIEGTEEFVATARRAGIPVFLASGTEEQELRKVARARNIDHWFNGIHGSPTRKPEIISRIAESLHCEPSSMLFVGDAASDLADARTAGIPFAGLDPEVSSMFPTSVYCVDSLAGLQPRDVWLSASRQQP